MSNGYEKTFSLFGIELSSIYSQFLGERADECFLEKKNKNYPFNVFLRNGFVFVGYNKIFSELQNSFQIASSNGALNNYQLQEVFISKVLKNLNSDNFAMFTVPNSEV